MAQMTTVVGTFHDPAAAKRALEALRRDDFAAQSAEIMQGGPDRVGKALAEDGFADEDARELVEAAASGQTLVAARVAPEKAGDAAALMDRFDEGGSEEGEEQKSVPVVEEKVEVGKRKAGARGVRVVSHVQEKPVEETVRLREDHVEAERRDADRELSPEEAEAAFKEKSVEVTATREEAEVEKSARVIGEVAVKKETGEREETVRDTARKTDVEVEQVRTRPERQ